MQNKNMMIGVAIVLVLVAFFVGKSYGASHAKSATTGTFARTSFAGAGRTRGAGAFSTGSILSVSGNTLTMSLQSGGSQIVVLGTSTPILKSTVGTTADLTAGTNVMITGTTNSDGSLTAQSIQIRPAGMTGFGGGRPQGAPVQ